jgi:hypothetical protein
MRSVISWRDRTTRQLATSFAKLRSRFLRAMSEGNHVDWPSIEAAKDKLERQLIAKGVDPALAIAEVNKMLYAEFGSRRRTK